MDRLTWKSLRAVHGSRISAANGGIFPAAANSFEMHAAAKEAFRQYPAAASNEPRVSARPSRRQYRRAPPESADGDPVVAANHPSPDGRASVPGIENALATKPAPSSIRSALLPACKVTINAPAFSDGTPRIADIGMGPPRHHEGRRDRQSGDYQFLHISLTCYQDGPSLLLWHIVKNPRLDQPALPAEDALNSGNTRRGCPFW
jgi:hypothetical protein